MRILRIIRNGKKHDREREREIPSGAKGNLETLAEMRKIVLEDSQETDLKHFVNREIIGLDKNSLAQKVEAVFKYASHRIEYLPEMDGFETVADLWSCLYALNPETATGDCVLKSVFIATCLSFLNLKPNFVAIQQLTGVDFFNHVFVNCKIDGVLTAMDATPENFRVGDELNFVSKLVYPIF